MFKLRTLARTILRAVKTFPSIVVTGPRQSGKTTLLKTMFSKTHRFVSLENPDVRIRAGNKSQNCQNMTQPKNYTTY